MVLEKDFANDKNTDVKIFQEDIVFLNCMEENIHWQEDKHLKMRLPFKGRPILPNNKALALIRLDHLKRKIRQDQTYLEQYRTCMTLILKRGNAEQVTTEGASGNTWYIPHHGLCHPRKPGKLRVVFDCSARYKTLPWSSTCWQVQISQTLWMQFYVDLDNTLWLSCMMWKKSSTNLLYMKQTEISYDSYGERMET